ncbi:hypothetical protein DENSPDRAFT_594414 [Dentipellis sp. KUC8613]|nr:hypothetical protein DENSPDRAFT_594414 [Dentipellis sp. KUC8613]
MPAVWPAIAICPCAVLRLPIHVRATVPLRGTYPSLGLSVRSSQFSARSSQALMQDGILSRALMLAIPSADLRVCTWGGVLVCARVSTGCRGICPSTPAARSKSPNS